ncbi:MAG: hypothetical protein L3J21_09885 [Devosiaceae bacterium]|nr:hypothetical protein [Devosiaceae bacterium]
MTTENAADATANGDISPTEQVDLAATEIQTEEIELTPEQQAEETAKVEQQKQANESRTQKRRRQRNAKELRTANDARQKAEIDAAYWRGKAESGGAQKEDGDKEPQQDDFDDYDEYIDAKVDWKFSKLTKSQSEPKAAQAEEAKSQSPEFTTFSDAGTRKYGADWADMMDAAQNNEYPTTQLMAETMMTDDHGVDMAMHFYDHPEDASRIAKLSPLQQVKELTKLGDALKGKSGESPVKKISGAPEPVTSERGTAASNGRLDGLSMQDYVARRRKQRK